MEKFKKKVNKIFGCLLVVIMMLSLLQFPIKAAVNDTFIAPIKNTVNGTTKKIDCTFKIIKEVENGN
ncbi:MAG: hypothetical protein EOM50_04820 [Erysipelotrichia bacterium]|nr:hypothetical protein [Erysipelotrichia bacterium]